MPAFLRHSVLELLFLLPYSISGPSEGLEIWFGSGGIFRFCFCQNPGEGALCTANIFDVIFTVFKCVRLSTVVSLYGLHLIAAPSTAGNQLHILTDIIFRYQTQHLSSL